MVQVSTFSAVVGQPSMLRLLPGVAEDNTSTASDANFVSTMLFYRFLQNIVICVSEAFHIIVCVLWFGV